MNDLIMIIAITGGSGFIGRELVKYYLQTSHQVRILTRKNLPKNVKYISFIGDLTDPNVNFPKNIYCHNYEVQLDKQYYREERLKKILHE